MRLMILWGSSREGRGGGVVADWARRHAENDKRFDTVDFVDPRELDLPFYDEPGRSGPFSFSSRDDYKNPKGKDWAERVGRAEGVIIITPEYNHSYPAILKNALDWVGPEWVDKPVGFVSYGGVSGGARVVEQLRTVTIELGLIQVANPIHFVFYKQSFNEQGESKHDGSLDQLKAMFDEINRLFEIFCHAKKLNLSAGQCSLDD